jgi:hypothetical protein
MIVIELEYRASRIVDHPAWRATSMTVVVVDRQRSVASGRSLDRESMPVQDCPPAAAAGEGGRPARWDEVLAGPAPRACDDGEEG